MCHSLNNQQFLGEHQMWRIIQQIYVFIEFTMESYTAIYMYNLLDTQTHNRWCNSYSVTVIY